MRLEKIKRKIAEGLKDEEIANMSGMSVEEVAKVRAPAPKKPINQSTPKYKAKKK